MTVSEKLQVVVVVLLCVFGAAYFSAWPTYTIDFF